MSKSKRYTIAINHGEANEIYTVHVTAPNKRAALAEALRYFGTEGHKAEAINSIDWES